MTLASSGPFVMTSPAPSAPSLPPLSATIVNHAYVSTYIEAAAFTALIYDHLITLPAEINLIWGSSASLVKCLFLLNRYSVLVVLSVQSWSMAGFGAGLDDQFCRSFFFAVSVFQLITAGGISPFLLFLRVWAIWGRKRTVQILVGGLCVLNFVAILITASLNIWKLLPDLYYEPHLNRCLCAARPQYIWTIWIAPLIYETVIFGLIAYKTLKHMREDFDTPLITTLWRDGILYYSVLVVVRVYTILAWLVAPPSLFFMAIYLMLATITTMASRTLLHLRAAARHREDDLDSRPLSGDLLHTPQSLGIRVTSWREEIRSERASLPPTSPRLAEEDVGLELEWLSTLRRRE